MKKERTIKQKQASNRAFALMTLAGIKTRLNQLKEKTNDKANKNALSQAATYCDYAAVIIEESQTEDWNP